MGSEQVSSWADQSNPREYAEALAARTENVLSRAVEIGYPGMEGHEFREVFPAPPAKRDEALDPGWTDEQQTAMRALVAELGPGRKEDRNLPDVDLSGAVVMIEGGQPHKMVAEMQMAADSPHKPSMWVLLGSPHRQITAPGEQQSAIRQFRRVPTTEYEVARAVAEILPGFVPGKRLPPEHALSAQGDEILQYSYDIRDGFALGHELTGQFVEVGTQYSPDDEVGTPVTLMRVDREDYVDDAGKPRYRNQPGPADAMTIVSGTMMSSDLDTPLVFVTSATYEPSRAIDGARVGLKTGHAVRVMTYGTDRMAQVGGPISGLEVRQIPGELYVAAGKLALLQRELAATA